MTADNLTALPADRASLGDRLLVLICQVQDTMDADTEDEATFIPRDPEDVRSLLREAMGALDRQALLAARDAERVAWQPIGTVPKDGRMVLCWVSAERIGEDDDGNQRTQDVSECDFGRWQTSEHGGYFDNMMDRIGDQQMVTHWMPIPPAPSAEQIAASFAAEYDAALQADTARAEERS